MKPGESVILADGAGHDYEVELTELTARAGKGVVVAERPSPAEPSVEIVLYQSLVRPQRFELVLEKGTEVGVARFAPLISSRAQVKGETGPERLRRWRRIVTEAAEQCGRGSPPSVDRHFMFDEAVRSALGLKLIPWEGETSRSLRACLRGLSEKPTTVSLFIGPEGGFEPDEIRLATEHGCVSVSLGPRLLRSETAGIVAVALTLYELEGSEPM